MAVDRVDAESDQLGVALGELGLDLGHVAKLGGADRGEVLGMGEQDRPLVADPLVEIDRSLRRLSREVGRGVVDAKSHGNLRCVRLSPLRLYNLVNQSTALGQCPAPSMSRAPAGATVTAPEGQAQAADARVGLPPDAPL